MSTFIDKVDIPMLDDLLADLNPWWANAAARTSAPSVRRALQPVVLNGLRGSDRRALVLVGPRQVGKTVLLRQCIDDLLDAGWPPGNITYFDFSDDRLTSVVTTPRAVLEQKPPSFVREHRRAILLDEVGRVEGWADWLKQMVDREAHRILVTDSAAHLLHDKGRESGLGRWEEHTLEGLTYREYLAFQARPGEPGEQAERRLPNPLEAFLFFGGFPEHVHNQSLAQVRQRVRIDIADRALLRDLQQTGVDVQRVRDLFVYLMEDSGSIFDGQSRSRALVRMGDDRPDKRSMEKWLGLLIDTHLVVRVDLFATQATGKLGGRARPKLYAVDQGLITAFASTPRPLGDSRLRAQVTEAAVLRAMRSTSPEGVTYAREVTETDFIVQRFDGRVAVEVTSSGQLRGKPNEVRERFGKAQATRALVVHGGLEEDAKGTIVPIHRFLLDPDSYLKGR